MKFTTITITALALVFASTDAAPTTTPSSSSSTNPSAMLKRQHPYQHTDSCGGSTFDNHWYSDAPWEGDCLTMIERQTTGYHSVELGWKKLLSYNTCAFSARLIDIPITDGIPLWWRNVGDDDMWDLTREGGKRGWVRDGKVAFGGVTECDEGHVEWKVHRN